jgi:hypothetical protein
LERRRSHSGCEPDIVGKSIGQTRRFSHPIRCWLVSEQGAVRSGKLLYLFET